MPTSSSGQLQADNVDLHAYVQQWTTIMTYMQFSSNIHIVRARSYARPDHRRAQQSVGPRAVQQHPRASRRRQQRPRVQHVGLQQRDWG